MARSVATVVTGAVLALCAWLSATAGGAHAEPPARTVTPDARPATAAVPTSTAATSLPAAARTEDPAPSIPPTTRPSTTAVTPGPTLGPAVPVAPARPRGKVIHLTFDDGPDPRYTPQILAILRRHHVPATFFMIGEEATRFPDLARAVRAAGHAVGNHTYTHPWLTGLSAAAQAGELRRTAAAVGGTTCLRPPGGMSDAGVRAVAHGLGLTIVGWDVDTRDWSAPPTAQIRAAALAGNDAGTWPRTVLMHDGGGDRSHTVAALPSIIEGLRRQGVRFETIPACR